MAFGSVSPDADGSWAIDLSVPAGTPGGIYLAVAFCDLGDDGYNGGDSGFEYPEVELEVIGGVVDPISGPPTPEGPPVSEEVTPPATGGTGPATGGTGPATGSASGDGTLPRTGSDLGNYILVGHVLVAAGGSVHYLSKRNMAV